MSQMDSTQADGTQDANPAVSAGAVQPNSFDPVKFEERLMSKVSELISNPRTVQGVKDKLAAEFKKDKGFRDFLAEYQTMREKGMTDEQISLEARLRELETRNSVPEVPVPGKAPAVPQANETVNKLLTALGMDANDPLVSSILAGDGQSEQKIDAIVALSERKKVQPNPALVAQPAGGSSAPVSNAQLEAQYKKEVMANRGNKPAILELQQRFLQQGLDIYSVNFP